MKDVKRTAVQGTSAREHKSMRARKARSARETRRRKHEKHFARKVREYVVHTG